MKKTTVALATCITLMAASLTAAEVKDLWKEQCTKCHGDDGKGDTKMGQKLKVKDYTDPKVQDEMKLDQAFKAVKEGLKDGDKTLMKPADKLSDAEIKALIAHMRSFKKA